MHISVLGAGSWGTALALVLARNHYAVRLWGPEAADLLSMQTQRVNHRYLPGHVFPPELSASSDLSYVLDGARDVLLVVPSHAFESVLMRAKAYFPADVRLAWGTKGLDPGTGDTLDAVVCRVLGEQVPVAVLSGPSFATEVAAGLPTALTIASRDETLLSAWMEYASSEVFRLYQSFDVRGVELCGVLKNVLAIATGLCDSLALGANARSALITRGIAELSRLLVARGGQQETLLTLAGIGDIILTCTTDTSRNRRFGLALGAGTSIEAAKNQVGQVVEGYLNTAQLYRMAQTYQVEMPIVTTLYEVLYRDLSISQAVKKLLARDGGRLG